MAEIGDVFTEGTKVPNSGIYDVIHDKLHTRRHQVTCVFNEPFPPCNHCGKNVKFRLAVKAIHLKDYPEFKKE